MFKLTQTDIDNYKIYVDRELLRGQTEITLPTQLVKLMLECVQVAADLASIQEVERQ